MATELEGHREAGTGADGRGTKRSVAGRFVTRRALPPLVVFAVGVAVWSALASSVPPVVLPTPAAVASTLVVDAPALASATLVSGVTAVAGLGIGTAVGLVLAFLIVSSVPCRAVVHPAVVALRVAPLTAVAPLVFLWFGKGLAVRAVLVATLTVFPITVASVDGLRSTPRAYLDLVDSVGVSPARAFVSVRVPAALPSVFAGFKLAAALAVTGTVVAELLTLRAGLGTRIFEAGEFLRTAELFAALVVLAALGTCFYGVAALAERAATRRWGDYSTQRTRRPRTDTAP